MEQFKRAKVVLLPSEKKIEALKGYSDNSLLFNYKKEYKDIPAEVEYVSFFHLYIISNDEIKEGDYGLDIETGWIFQCKEDHSDMDYYIGMDNKIYHTNNDPHCCKKIIATTDTSLKLHDNNGKNHCFGTQLSGNCKHILPQPSQQFITKYIEEYNKDKVIIDVLVEYEKVKDTWTTLDTCTLTYKEKLKINPKDNTITIKKVKDNWNTEEMFKLMDDYQDYLFRTNEPVKTFKEWFNQNL